MNDQIWEKLVDSRSILLSCHPRPDNDSVSSNLALMGVLTKMGKKVTLISGDDNKPPKLAFLPGYEKIVNKQFSEINLDDFDLLACLDIGGPSRLTSKASLEFPLSIPTIVIDHHHDNPKFGELNWIEAGFTSTSEMIWQMVEEHAPELIDLPFSTCVYSGIWGDTGGFVSEKMKIETFEIIGKCIASGVKANEIIGTLLSAPANQLNLLGYALSNAGLVFGGKVFATKVAYQEFKSRSISDEDIGSCKELVTFQLQRVSEAPIVVMNYEYEPNIVSVSLRSYNPKEFYDISKIAKKLGGGGHPQAASFKFDGTVDEAEKKLFEAIQQIYPELGQP